MPEYPHKYWAVSDDKEGYSGVAMLCKTEPLKVTYGIGEWFLHMLLSRHHPAHKPYEVAHLLIVVLVQMTSNMPN